MKSCSLILLVEFLMGVVVLFSGVRRTAGLVGDRSVVSANDELPRGSGDEGLDTSIFGSMVAPCSCRKDEMEIVGLTRLVVART